MTMAAPSCVSWLTLYHGVLLTRLFCVCLSDRSAVSSFGWSMTYVTESNRVGRLGPMGATEVSGKDPHRNAWDTALAHNPLNMPHLV